MELVKVLDEMQMAFFSFGERDHDIAVKRSGVRVEFTADHVLTKSVYFFDPDGSRLEIFSQELPGVSAKQYLHKARVAADVMRPLDLEREEERVSLHRPPEK